MGRNLQLHPPSFTPNLGTLTVRHLLEHSAGLHGDFEWQPTPQDYINVEAIDLMRFAAALDGTCSTISGSSEVRSLAARRRTPERRIL